MYTLYSVCPKIHILLKLSGYLYTSNSTLQLRVFYLLVVQTGADHRKEPGNSQRPGDLVQGICYACKEIMYTIKNKIIFAYNSQYTLLCSRVISFLWVTLLQHDVKQGPCIYRQFVFLLRNKEGKYKFCSFFRFYASIWWIKNKWIIVLNLYSVLLRVKNKSLNTYYRFVMFVFTM